MKHALFVRSYHKDAERLRYCLQSILKFCKGFDDTVVVCPPSSEKAIYAVVKDFPFARYALTQEYERDYLGQQRDKIGCYDFTDADYIHFIDSDCVFIKEYYPNSMFRDNLPLLYHREYSFYYERGIWMPWQSITSNHILHQVNFEFMQSFPLIHPRNLCSSLVDWFTRIRGGLDNIIASLPDQYTFSEFNLLGAASYYKICSDLEYHVHVNRQEEEPEQFVKQYCLTSGHIDRSISDDERAELASIVG